MPRVVLRRPRSPGNTDIKHIRSAICFDEVLESYMVTLLFFLSQSEENVWFLSAGWCVFGSRRGWPQHINPVRMIFSPLESVRNICQILRFCIILIYESLSCLNGHSTAPSSGWRELPQHASRLTMSHQCFTVKNSVKCCTNILLQDEVC